MGHCFQHAASKEVAMALIAILRQQFFARNMDPCEAKNGINRTSLSWKGRSTPSQLPPHQARVLYSAKHKERAQSTKSSSGFVFQDDIVPHTLQKSFQAEIASVHLKVLTNAITRLCKHAFSVYCDEAEDFLVYLWVLNL